MIGLLLCAALVSALPEHDLAVSRRKVVAGDGVALALYRYAPLASGRPPVLLIADFGLGRAAFDWQGAGLARYLARHGRTVYVAEVRGQGKAAVAGWTPADVLQLDLPAIAAAIPEPTFDVVAHGWAGTLALAASVTEWKGRVGKVVSLSTPAEFMVPSPLALAALKGGGKFSSLGGDPEGAKIFELLFAMNGLFSPDQLTSLRSDAMTDFGPRASNALIEWMTWGDLTLRTGESLKARLKAYDRPTIQFLGLANGWANPELCGVLREVSSATVKLRVFSRFDYLSEDYSHLSLLQGKHARREIFAHALKFLDEDTP